MQDWRPHETIKGSVNCELTIADGSEKWLVKFPSDHNSYHARTTNLNHLWIIEIYPWCISKNLDGIMDLADADWTQIRVSKIMKEGFFEVDDVEGDIVEFD